MDQLKVFVHSFYKKIIAIFLLLMLGACVARQEQYSLKLMEEFYTIAETKKTKDGVVVTLKEKILFDFNKYELKPESQTSLVKIAEILRRYPEAQVYVEGYTDNMGPTAANEILSKKRAQAVDIFFIKNGLNPSRILSQGLGSKNPVADNGTPEGRAENRRVELHIVPN
jgi:outer membrane protein OmpA-like peptidoglycan-associated protein